MTDYYLDTSLGSGDDDGTTPANAWRTLIGALETTTPQIPSGAHTLWCRRSLSHTPASDILLTTDGNIDGFCKIIGWPRDDHTGTADVYNGFPAFVDVSDQATISRVRHQARMIQNDTDGNDYLITAIGYWVPYDDQASAFVERETITTVGGFSGEVLAVKDDGATGHVLFSPGWTGTIADDEQLTSGATDRADAVGAGEKCFIIDRNYQGADAADGAYTIAMDDDFTDRPAAAKATWDADDDDIFIVDMNDAGYLLTSGSDDYWDWRNIEFRDCDSFYGMNRAGSPGGQLWRFQGCLFKETEDATLYKAEYTDTFFERCTFEGAGSGAAQKMQPTQGRYYFQDCAIYNMGGNGIDAYNADCYLDNVNIGVELPNGAEAIDFIAGGFIIGKDVKLGSDAGLVGDDAKNTSYVAIENYQKVFGDHIVFYRGGTIARAAVDPETPDKKVSDYVIKITPENDFQFERREFCRVVFQHEFEATADSKTYKYWLFNDASYTLNDTLFDDDIWLEAEYVKEYTEDTEEYLYGTAYSADIDIADNGGATDWDSLSVTVDPATASKVRITCRCRAYASGSPDDIFIDPAVVIT